MPFHHKVEEGLLKCSDCHDPHGTFDKKNLRVVGADGCRLHQVPHRDGRARSCMSTTWSRPRAARPATSPHGGPNPRLLNRANVNTICLQCHSPSPNFTTSQPLGPAHNQAAQYQSCTICHTSIHGSNISAVFFNSN